jgi:hypothetical protein
MALLFHSRHFCICSEGNCRQGNAQEQKGKRCGVSNYRSESTEYKQEDIIGLDECEVEIT